MLNKITIGIAQALNEEFGDEKSIYTDEIEQELESCFYITPLTAIENLLVGKRYERSYPFMIQYFPKEKNYSAECNEVTEQMLNALEYITLDEGLIRGEDMTSHIVDGVLNFEVTYKMHIFKKKTSADEVMESLDQEISIKE